MNIPLLVGMMAANYVDGSVELTRDPMAIKCSRLAMGPLCGRAVYAGSGWSELRQVFNRALGYDVDSVATADDGSFAIADAANGAIILGTYRLR